MFDLPLEATGQPARLHRRGFLHTAGLGALTLSALSRAEQQAAAAEGTSDAAIPDAQLGTLFPFVEKTAVPPVSVTVARTVVFSRNSTEPVATALPAPDTVAVNVTCSPNTDGFTEGASAVVEAAAFTVCVGRLADAFVTWFEPPS